MDFFTFEETTWAGVVVRREYRRIPLESNERKFRRKKACGKT